MAKDMMGKVAIWAFIIGALIALLVGLWQAYTIEQNQQPVFTTDMGGWIAWILAILGAIVGKQKYHHFS
jgi:ABC-type xylose transport system permease subunit